MRVLVWAIKLTMSFEVAVVATMLIEVAIANVSVVVRGGRFLIWAFIISFVTWVVVAPIVSFASISLIKVFSCTSHVDAIQLIIDAPLYVNQSNYHFVDSELNASSLDEVNHREDVLCLIERKTHSEYEV